jgi:hypothetical protein
METFVSCIQLSYAQAKRVIDEYYSIHVDYNCPIDERTLTNPDFVKNDDYERNRKALMNILTSPVGTTFHIDVKWAGGVIRKVGYTRISSGNQSITGYRDESCDHITIAQAFIRAKSFGWFKSKFPCSQQSVLA